LGKDNDIGSTVPLIPLSGGVPGKRSIEPAAKPRFDYLNFGADSDDSEKDDK